MSNKDRWLRWASGVTGPPPEDITVTTNDGKRLHPNRPKTAQEQAAEAMKHGAWPAFVRYATAEWFQADTPLTEQAPFWLKEWNMFQAAWDNGYSEGRSAALDWYDSPREDWS